MSYNDFVRIPRLYLSTVRLKLITFGWSDLFIELRYYLEKIYKVWIAVLN